MNPKLFKALSIAGHILGTALTVTVLSLAGLDEFFACLLGFLLFTIFIELSQLDVFVEDKIINQNWSLWQAIKSYYWGQTSWNVTQNLLGVILFLLAK